MLLLPCRLHMDGMVTANSRHREVGSVYKRLELILAKTHELFAYIPGDSCSSLCMWFPLSYCPYDTM
jgi:hypothetical protein